MNKGVLIIIISVSIVVITGLVITFITLSKSSDDFSGNVSSSGGQNDSGSEEDSGGGIFSFFGSGSRSGSSGSGSSGSGSTSTSTSTGTGEDGETEEEAVCGNNIKETGETCDGTDLAGENCVTRGFTGGTLTCTTDCLGYDTSSCTTEGGDTTAPIRSNGAPSGTLSSGTTQTTISLSTNENANCRYSTSAGIAYASMTTFSTTGTTTHSQLITGLTNGQSYTYYVKCSDIVGNVNTNDYIISFSIDSGPPPPIQKISVEIENFAYNPSTLTINVSDIVVWPNLDEVLHTVTSDSGDELDSGPIEYEDVYRHVFNTPGAYDYHCEFYPDMSGTVIVLE